MGRGGEAPVEGSAAPGSWEDGSEAGAVNDGDGVSRYLDESPLSPRPGAQCYGGTRPSWKVKAGARGNIDGWSWVQNGSAMDGEIARDVAVPALTPTDTDHDLLRRAAGGERGAFHELVGRHTDGLFRLAVSLSKNRSDAEDVLQETFVGAYRGMARFNGRASVKTWLTQILIRQAAKMCHKTKRSRQAVAIDSPAGAATGESLSRPSNETATDRRLDLTAVIDCLPVDHRQIILLREIQGLSYEEIARVLGVPQGTVESRLHRARAGLKQRLKGYAA